MWPLKKCIVKIWSILQLLPLKVACYPCSTNNWITATKSHVAPFACSIIAIIKCPHIWLMVWLNQHLIEYHHSWKRIQFEIKRSCKKIYYYESDLAYFLPRIGGIKKFVEANSEKKNIIIFLKSKVNPISMRKNGH